MTNKEAVIELIRNLPDDVTVDENMAELSTRGKIEEGLRQLDRGDGLSHQQAKQRLSRWLK